MRRPCSAAALEKYFLWVGYWLRHRLLQYVIAEQRGCGADIQTVDTDFVDFATMFNAHLVVCHVHQALAQPEAFGTHHQYGRML
jgi:hypothetical protein